MASLLLDDPMADLAGPWVAVQVMFVRQETERSPGLALLTDGGQPFAMRIISKREGGKLFTVNLKNASRHTNLPGWSAKMESYWSQVLTPSCMLVTHSLQSPRHL